VLVPATDIPDDFFKDLQTEGTGVKSRGLQKLPGGHSSLGQQSAEKFHDCEDQLMAIEFAERYPLTENDGTKT